MAEDDRVTDPKEIASYIESARGLYNLDQDVNAIEIADPPVIVRTPAGAKVMAWLPVEDEDRWS